MIPISAGRLSQNEIAKPYDTVCYRYRLPDEVQLRSVIQDNDLCLLAFNLSTISGFCVCLSLDVNFEWITSRPFTLESSTRSALVLYCMS